MNPSHKTRPTPIRAQDIAVLLGFLLGLSLYIVGQFEDYTWVLRDGRFYVDSNETLLNDFTYEESFARSWYEQRLGWNYNLPAGFSNVALGQRGELYHFRPYVLPVAATPFYFAFGLFGVLLFNLGCYGVIAACGYRFAAHFSGRKPAALAVGLWLVGTGLVETLYDYSVDALLLACFTAAMLLILRKRGGLAGILMGVTLLIKPTTLLYMPAAVALFAELEREQRKRVLLSAIGGGAVVLGLGGLINTYMYGNPWTFGYQRVVEVVAGEIQLASSAARFTTPLAAGLERSMIGGYGLLTFYGVFAVAPLGLVGMLRRHCVYAAASLLSTGAALLVFSLYQWESDRFQYVSFALLLPWLAIGLRSLASLAKRLPSKVRPKPLIALVGVAAALISIAQFGRGHREHPWRPQVTRVSLAAMVSPDPTERAIQLVAEHHRFDLRDAQEAGADIGPLNRQSAVSQGRFGHWLPRGNLVVVALSAAAQSLRARWLLNALLAAFVFAFLFAASRKFAPAPARLALLAVAMSLSPLRDVLAVGGAGLFAALGMAAALFALSKDRLRLAVAATLTSAWLLASPFFPPLWLLLAVALRRTDRRALETGIGGILLIALYGLLVYGRPFAAPESFVLVDLLGEVAPSLVHPVPTVALWQAHPARAALVLSLVGMIGAFLALRTQPLVGAFGLAMGAAFLLPEGHVGGALSAGLVLAITPFAVIPIAALSAVLEGIAASPKRRRIALQLALGILLVSGTGWRVAQAHAPLRIATFNAVRHAEVTLGPFPCDFLTWESMSWECAHYDGGGEGRAGLQYPGDSSVAGVPMPLFVVPVGRNRRRERTVRFARANEGPHGVHLEFVMPDGYHRPASFTALWGERILDNHDVKPGDSVQTTHYEVEGPGPLVLIVHTEENDLTAIGFAGGVD